MSETDNHRAREKMMEATLLRSQKHQARSTPSLSSLAAARRWMDRDREADEAKARVYMAVGGGGGWRRKARMDCGPRLGCVCVCNPGATRPDSDAEICPRSLALPLRVFLLAFFAVTATSPHPPTTATATAAVCAGRPLSDHLSSSGQGVREVLPPCAEELM